MKSIASFDMDMTLLDHTTWEIPHSAKEAISRLREHYYIVIATGRDMDAKFSAGLAEMVEPDAIIHLNGTKITVGDQMIYEHLMAKDLVERLLKFAEGQDFSIGMTTGAEDYYMNEEFIVRHDMALWGESDRKFKDPWELLHRKVRTLTYIGNETGARMVEDAFPEVKLPMFSSGEGADLVEKSASKAEGLKRLCEYYGVALKDTVAFGDSMNDYEILKEAGTGVAMGNSIEKLKQVADYVTVPIGQNGIWHACKVLGLID